MHKFKALFKLLDDDLRDAEFHKIFKQEVEKVEDKSKTDTVERCLWKESHKKYQSWYNCLREDVSKIQEKYK